MRHWKIAVSLAVAGALASPFAFGTWKMPTKSYFWVPLTEEQKTNITRQREQTNNCETLRDSTNATSYMTCVADGILLEDGGYGGSASHILGYVAVNSAVAGTTLLVVFLLGMLLPGLTRYYLTWLNR
jgi:hypothetical protein